MASGPLTVQIGLTDDAAKVVDVLEAMFEHMDDLEEFVPEWNEFERQRLGERRNQLAALAAALITKD